jgi:glycosyltransferase involved in cell wall biosynthesis
VSQPYDVLFSIPWAGPLLAGSGPSGGAETQIVMLAKGLAAAGMKVALLAIGARGELPSEVAGVDVIRQRPSPAVRGVGGVLHDLASVAAIARTPARVVVQRNASRGVAVAAAAARLRRAGFVYSSANVVDFDAGQIDSRPNVWLFERAAKRADEVVVQTGEQAELCRRRLGRDPVVIRSIAEPATPRTTEPEAFLWIGRMASYKRLDVYLDLVAAVPEARFQAIATPGLDGSPDLAARLERARRELPNLELLEPRPRSALAPLLERAVAIVNTSEYEGMPNVFLEAWSRGVPALAYSHDPDGVVAEHGLGSFADGSRERLTELARAMWERRNDQAEVADRCLRYVRREHDLGVVCDAWRATLTAVAERR